MRCYYGGVAVKKLSVALDETVAREAALAAEKKGLSMSAWLNAAAERALLIEGGLAAMDDWEAEHGPPSEEAVAWADAALNRVGIVPSDRR